jgi:hypothetical protein
MNSALESQVTDSATPVVHGECEQEPMSIVHEPPLV